MRQRWFECRSCITTTATYHAAQSGRKIDDGHCGDGNRAVCEHGRCAPDERGCHRNECQPRASAGAERNEWVYSSATSRTAASEMPSKASHSPPERQVAQCERQDRTDGSQAMVYALTHEHKHAYIRHGQGNTSQHKQMHTHTHAHARARARARAHTHAHARRHLNAPDARTPHHRSSPGSFHSRALAAGPVFSRTIRTYISRLPQDLAAPLGQPERPLERPVWPASSGAVAGAQARRDRLLRHLVSLVQD